jgi:hypothetical protein
MGADDISLVCPILLSHKPFQDPDPTVRQRACGAIQQLSTREVGTRDLMQYEGVPKLVERLEDKDSGVKDAAYR